MEDRSLTERVESLEKHQAIHASFNHAGHGAATWKTTCNDDISTSRVSSGSRMIRCIIVGTFAHTGPPTKRRPATAVLSSEPLNIRRRPIQTDRPAGSLRI